MLKNKTNAFSGAGTMAEAMISGIVKSRKIPLNQVFVTNNSNTKRLQQLEKVYGINGVTKGNLNFEKIDMFILAMKPKDVKTAIQSIRHSLQPQ
jgi:pyrroline-5-carboxylate reductase